MQGSKADNRKATAGRTAQRNPSGDGFRIHALALSRSTRLALLLYWRSLPLFQSMRVILAAGAPLTPPPLLCCPNFGPIPIKLRPRAILQSLPVMQPSGILQLRRMPSLP